jgi:hypothetical protein
MADCNHTPPAAAPGEDIMTKLGWICMQGHDLVQIACLLETCSEGIYKEMEALKRLFRGGLMEHTQALTHRIDFLADTVLCIGKEIEERGNDVSDLLSGRVATTEAGERS